MKVVGRDVHLFVIVDDIDIGADCCCKSDELKFMNLVSLAFECIVVW